MTEKKWVVYILECRDSSMYTGITNDLEERVRQHNLKKGAKYTKSRLPVKVVYRCFAENRSEASKVEAAIKKLTRQQKLQLVAGLEPKKETMQGLPILSNQPNFAEDLPLYFSAIFCEPGDFDCKGEFKKISGTCIQLLDWVYFDPKTVVFHESRERPPIFRDKTANALFGPGKGYCSLWEIKDLDC